MYRLTLRFQHHALQPKKACKGKFEVINVDVHYIRNLTIDGTPTTCPNTPVVLTAKTTGTNMKATASYTWTCADNSDNTTKTKRATAFTLRQIWRACR